MSCGSSASDARAIGMQCGTIAPARRLAACSAVKCASHFAICMIRARSSSSRMANCSPSVHHGGRPSSISAVDAVTAAASASSDRKSDCIS